MYISSLNRESSTLQNIWLKGCKDRQSVVDRST